jgi:hypothetical protein
MQAVMMSRPRVLKDNITLTVGFITRDPAAILT